MGESHSFSGALRSLRSNTPSTVFWLATCSDRAGALGLRRPPPNAAGELARDPFLRRSPIRLAALHRCGYLADDPSSPRRGAAADPGCAGLHSVRQADLLRSLLCPSRIERSRSDPWPSGRNLWLPTSSLGRAAFAVLISAVGASILIELAVCIPRRLWLEPFRRPAIPAGALHRPDRGTESICSSAVKRSGSPFCRSPSAARSSSPSPWRGPSASSWPLRWPFPSPLLAAMSDS